MLSLLVAAAFPAPEARAVDAYDRLARVEQAWPEANRAGKEQAISFLYDGRRGLISKNWSMASLAFDRAAAALEERSLRAADAVCVSPLLAAGQPGSDTTLSCYWAYSTGVSGKVGLQAGPVNDEIVAGRLAELVFKPSWVSPYWIADHQGTASVEVKAGDRVLSTLVSAVKGYENRAGLLKASTHPAVQDRVELLKRREEGRLAWDAPVVQPLFEAEAIEANQLDPIDMTIHPLVVRGRMELRAVLPPKEDEAVTVVLAFPPAGGDESWFFLAGNGGQAVREAMDRRWGFIGLNSRSGSAQAAVEWLTTEMGRDLHQVFVMGQGTGANIALLSGRLAPLPSAAVALHPTGGRIPPNMAGVPIFAAFGSVESPLSKGTAEQFKRQIGGLAQSQFEEVDPCGEMMIGYEAVEASFEFFDTAVRAPEATLPQG
jgi:hypothetical protein